MSTEQKPQLVPGMPQFIVIDNDHVQALVDGDEEIFSRHDVVHGPSFSGLRWYGPIHGDHRMIYAISADVAKAFRIIDGIDS